MRTPAAPAQAYFLGWMLKLLEKSVAGKNSVTCVASPLPPATHVTGGANGRQRRPFPPPRNARKQCLCTFLLPLATH